MGFAQDVLKNNDKALTAVNTQCYKIAEDLFNSVVALTPSPAQPGPWAKGHLVNQWYPSQGDELSSDVSDALDESGRESYDRIAQLAGGTEFFHGDGSVTMTNNLPYAGLAETYGWHFTGPYRMVALSLQAIAGKYS